MEPISGFCDLCISGTKNLKELKSTLQELVELEYKNVAIEQIYNDTTTDSKTKKSDPIPEPLKLDWNEFKGKLRIFNRLTIVFSDNAIALVTNKSQNLKKYDLIAVVPTTESALQYACQNFNCDIISYDCDTIRLKFSRTHYLQAVSRNIFFEIKYSPTITDSGVRKSTIMRAHKYRDLGKSKNIILSSGAMEKFQLRSPYDVANLGWIFGLTEEQSKESIRGQARKVLIRAEARKHGTMMVYVKKLKDLGIYESDEYSSDEEEKNDEKMDTIEEETTDENPNKKMRLM